MFFENKISINIKKQELNKISFYNLTNHNIEIRIDKFSCENAKNNLKTLISHVWFNLFEKKKIFYK